MMFVAHAFGWIAFLWIVFCLVIIPALEFGGHVSRKRRH